MSAEMERQAVWEVIRAWSDQPECDKLGAHEGEELADEIMAKAAPAIEEKARKEERERVAVHCDDKAARVKSCLGIEGLSEREDQDFASTALAYEAMARFVREEDISMQIEREADVTKEERIKKCPECDGINGQLAKRFEEAG